MSRIRYLLYRAATLVLAAIAVTVLVAWACSTCVDVALANPRSAEAMTGELIWTVQRWDRGGSTYVVSQTLKTWGWSPSQATGAPDTTMPGDQQTAWASLTADGQREWLCLEYDKAVIPKSVRIYENYHPGAVDRVTVFSADGAEIEAWQGKDPTPTSAQSGVSEIQLKIKFPIRKLTLHLNSPAVSDWNEIDAVALVSTTGQAQWARRATASSSYGAPPATPASVDAVKSLLPPWGSLARFSRVMENEAASSEIHAIDGRGWPLAALWCERDWTSGSAIAGALGSVHTPGPGGSAQPVLPAASNLPPSFSIPPAAIPASVLGSPAPLRPALPLRIIWRGFLADVAFYALILALLRWLLLRPWRLAVELSRMRHGRCIACGYDLGYDFRAGCPECGWRRKGKEAGKPAA